MIFRKAIHLAIFFLIFHASLRGLAQERKHFRTFAEKDPSILVDHFEAGEEVMNLTLPKGWAFFDGNEKLLFHLQHPKHPDCRLSLWTMAIKDSPSNTDSVAQAYLTEVQKLDPPHSVTGTREKGMTLPASNPLSYFLAKTERDETSRVATFFLHGNFVYCLDIIFGENFTSELRQDYDNIFSSITFEEKSAPEDVSAGEAKGE